MRSPELTGGAGFTFEANIGAVYLAGLLSRGTAAGLGDGRVARVAFQQSAHGEPLDDIIVDGVFADGSKRRLGLQVKRSINLGSGKSNDDFREIIHNSWKTLQKPDFKDGVDRFGGAVSTVSLTKLKALISIGERARNTALASEFLAGPGGNGAWNTHQRGILSVVRDLLDEIVKQKISDNELHRFFRHFLVLQFDLMHDGAAGRVAALSQLDAIVDIGAGGQTSTALSKLESIAEAAKNNAGALERKTLIFLLDGSVPLRGAASLQADICNLSKHCDAALKSVHPTIGGTHLTRTHLMDAAEKQLEENRLLYLRGLPGTGKSVVLRGLAERARSAGPVLFLKSDRLSGANWQEFATLNGFGAVSLAELLAEIAATGTTTLFIDGIDRISGGSRNIIIDLLAELYRDPDFADWRIVASARDEGVEPLRTWLPAECQQYGFAALPVTPLNDAESEQLAAEKPHLKGLLFGEPAVKEIVRRPFFAAILVNRPAEATAKSAPRSEIDLIEGWWASGGYAATESDRLIRNQTLLELAAHSAGQVGTDVRIAELSDTTKQQIAGLVNDGILTESERGSRVRFSHDIFHEWSLYKTLIDRGSEWHDFIIECGEPPALARSVSLMSQKTFFHRDGWGNELTRLQGNTSLRSQWVRSWLLAPISAPQFMEKFADYARVVEADDFGWLKRVMVWFQAERTVPNANILASKSEAVSLSRSELLRLADFASWPSDIEAWQRVLQWIVIRSHQWPASMVPAVIPVIQVWQNALASYSNQISDELIKLAQDWLVEIEDVNHSLDWKADKGKWAELSHHERESIEEELRRILLEARKQPDLVKQYLERLRTNKHLNRNAPKHVFSKSMLLAQSAPVELVDYSLSYLCRELPKDAIQRWDEEEKQQIIAREKARKRRESIPKEEWTFSDTMSAADPIGLRNQIHDYEWTKLAIADEYSAFSTTSPVREPFHSLFQNAPEQALRLVRGLCNHTVECWRQLSEIPYVSHGVPLPVSMSFPWGEAEYWGDRNTYLWFRGMLGPAAIECALEALEKWAFDRVERGDDMDDVIRDVVEGNNCYAVLGIASALAMEHQHFSAATLPLVTSQRLWHDDIYRTTQEHSAPLVHNMGLLSGQGGETDMQAIAQSAQRRCRQMNVRDYLAVPFIFNASEELTEKAQEAIRSFPDELTFAYEHEGQDEAYVQSLHETAQLWAELAKFETYEAYRESEDGPVLIRHNNPVAEKPDIREKSERSAQALSIFGLAGWAENAFEATDTIEKAKLDDALRKVKSVYQPGSLSIEDETGDVTQGVVAAVAALAVIRNDLVSPGDIKWAKRVLGEAEKIKPVANDHYSEHMIRTWHPVTYAARALAAEINRQPHDNGLQARLLSLIAFPNISVAENTLKAAFSCVGVAPLFSWGALELALRLSVLETKEGEYRLMRQSVPWTESQRNKATKSVAGAVKKGGYFDLMAPPDAWSHVIQDGETIQIEPDKFWRWDHMEMIAPLVPYSALLKSEPYRTGLLELLGEWLDWTILRDSGPDEDDPYRAQRRGRSELIKWRFALARALSAAYEELSVSDALKHSLTKILELPDDYCMDYLQSFVGDWVAAGIFDAEKISPETLEYLDHAVDRIIQHHDVKFGRYHGHDLDVTIRHLFMANLFEANGAVRFGNGDWSDVGLVLSLAEKLLDAGKNIPSLVSSFLRMCEAAEENIPAEWLADRLVGIVSQTELDLLEYNKRMIPSRIAVIVQQIADRDELLMPNDAATLLRVLDALIDMGDRRSAALQMSATFRFIRLTAT